jgi:hypothetical protein
MQMAVLGPGDARVLDRVAPDVFDGPVDPRWCAEFFADPRHHLAVAIDEGIVLGMVFAAHYVHPDKAPEPWIDGVGCRPRTGGAARPGAGVHPPPGCSPMPRTTRPGASTTPLAGQSRRRRR